MNLNITLVGEIITFVVFVWITMKWIWPPLVKAMEDRQKQIADGLAAAERGEHALELAQTKSTKILSKAKTHAGSIVDEAHVHASQLMDKAKMEGQKERKRLVDGAATEIERQTHRAKESLQSYLAELVVQSTQKILSQKMDKHAHEKMLHEVIEAI